MFLVFESIAKEKLKATELEISPYRSQFICTKHNNNLRSKNSTCIYCAREYRKKYYLTPGGRQQARRDYVEMRNKGYFETSEYKERLKNYRKTYDIKPESKEKQKEQKKKYYKTWKGKLVRLTAQRNYRKNHPEARYKKQYWDEQRRAKKLNATPDWNDELITQEIFNRTHNLNISLGLNKVGEKYVVDHIIPLKNKNVCGLHVWYNLLPLKGNENSSKSNNIPRQEELDKLPDPSEWFEHVIQLCETIISKAKKD